ncbi:MAG: MFS transporter [Planctomycetota bacterium]|nr:MFS transporter [Planctomycetota bacterium]
MRSPRPLAAIFLTVVIDLLGFGIVLPLLPLYADEWHASPTVIALLFTSFSALQFVSAPLWGRLSDRVGRRPVLLVGLAGSVVSYALFGVAAFQSLLGLLFVSRITAGLFGGTISTAYAYIADITSTEERGRGMALIGMAFGIGFTLGPAIGGFGHALHPAAPGLIAAALSLTAFLFAWRRLPEPERHVPAPRRSWLDLGALRSAMRAETIGAILLLSFVTITCFSLMESTVGLLGKRVYELKFHEIGLLFTYLGFWTALTQGMIVRRYMKRVGELKFAVLGTFTLGLGMLAFGLASTLGWLIALAPLAVLGFGMVTPSLNSLLSRRSAADVQGGVMGVNQSLQSLSRIVGPLIGLPLFGIDHALPFWAGAGMMGICFVLALALARRSVPDVS